MAPVCVRKAPLPLVTRFLSRSGVRATSPKLYINQSVSRNMSTFCLTPMHTHVALLTFFAAKNKLRLPMELKKKLKIWYKGLGKWY